MVKKTKPINFEKTFAELEELVAKMENDNISLEDSLKYFEQGIKLTHICQEELTIAEQKVQILLEKKDNKSSLTPFTSNRNKQ